MPSPPLSIIQPLSPRVAILTSDDVKLSCEANGCRGLEELLRPWEGGTERGMLSRLDARTDTTLTASIGAILHTHSDYPPLVSAPLRQLRLDLPESLRSAAAGSRSGHDWELCRCAETRYGKPAPGCEMLMTR
jgi:hypothetical protein